MGINKNTKANRAAVDREAFYSVEDAIIILKKAGEARKFDESVEISMNLNIDPRHADQTVRGMFSPPHGTGATVKVAVFARDDKAEAAKAAGADIVGAEDLADDIKAGNMDFDRVIATPDLMGIVGLLGKVLGPKGVMPTPKLGTVTPNVEKAVKDAKGGAIEFRAEKAGIVQAGVGKVSFDDKALAENIRAFAGAIQKARPSGAKGTYIAKISLSSTMGPGIKLDIANVQQAA